MYRPFLFVGLGGSGGKTLRYLKARTREWLTDQGWDGPIPESWQFLHIDTPTIPDGGELDEYVPPLDQSEYVGLVGAGVEYSAVAAALDSIEGMTNELIGWRIDPVSLAVPISEGAGQFRAVGRTVAMLQGPEIRTRLRNAFNRMKTPEARATLGTLFSQVNGRPPDANMPAPVVVMVSSLAGGTGAGLLINVADLITELGDSRDTIAVLYTPEVFGSVPGRAGVYPNSLAAISELMNGIWLKGTSDAGAGYLTVRSRVGQDMKLAGAAQSLSSSGPRRPFLVGMKNAAGSSFGSDRELFAMVGGALCSWLTDRSVQDPLIAYTKANWDQAAASNNPASDVLVNVGPAQENGLPLFNALGVSRLNIGLRYLEQYSSERLALYAANYLARAHKESDAAVALMEQENIRQPEQLAERIAERQLSLFLRVTGLTEKGTELDQNQVVDSLRPDIDELRHRVYMEAQQLAGVGSAGTAKGSEWVLRVREAIDPVMKRSFEPEYQRALQAKCRDWVELTQLRIVEEVEQQIASHGVRVGAALLRLAARYLLDPSGVVEELTSEQKQHNEWSTSWRDNVSSVLDSAGSRVDNNHPAIAEAISNGLHYAQLLGEARLRETAADVLRSLGESLLRPLAAELEGEADRLDEELRGPAANWPQWVEGAPPNHLVPPPSEITLISPNDFSRIFSELILSEDPARQEADRFLDVRREVITGRFLRASEYAQNKRIVGTPPAISIRSPWRPGHGATGSMEPQSIATFDVRFRPQELRDRGSAWLHRPGSEFATFLNQTLRTYLARDLTFQSQVPENEYENRRRQFIPKLQAALAAAAPLINLDTTLMAILHPGMAGKEYSPILSTLPFRNHPLEGSVKSLLESYFEGAANQVESMLSTDQQTTEISISSTLRRPCSPLVIESLLRPIASEWANASRTPIQVRQFWLRRRARPLEEFIPAPQAHILAMCRGWFTGASLGIIDRKAVPVRIGRARDVPASFPPVTLSSSGESRDQLALLLESLAIAYVQVSTETSLRPLDAYNALRDLGRPSDADDPLLEYPELSHIIEEWAQTGAATGGIVEPMVSGSNYLERLERLQDFLGGSIAAYRTDYEHLTEVWRKQRSKLAGPPLWPGIRWHIMTALDQLSQTLSVAVQNATSQRPGDYL